jgi:methyltransferase (TIGR00027 family)
MSPIFQVYKSNLIQPKSHQNFSTFKYSPNPKASYMKNPVSRTAYYTLAVRAWDASLPHPVCGDSFAQRFMSDEARKVWEEFKDYVRPNASNASRHVIIDNHLQKELTVSPKSLVIIIGAGFDSRAFRLNGGRWVEVDEHQIIELKEANLPATDSPNELTRLSIDFANEKIKDKLQRYATDQNVHIVIEGVLMYLNQAARQALLDQLRMLFPKHIVYCDLMRRSFFEKYSRALHEKIVALGATFSEMQEHPEDLFLKNGYALASSTSVALYAAQYGHLGIPAFMVRYFMRTLRDGYRISVFKFENPRP